MAKAKRFSWEKLGDKTYAKCWVKNIKANVVEQFIKECGFPVVILKE